jgi:hypothetical protein
MKRLHKRYYSLLAFYSELSFEQNKRIVVDTNTLPFLYECLSDFGQVFFCWLHGLYKAARMTLRSSIEVFLRAIAGQTNAAILSEKSIYTLFDSAILEPPFNLLMFTPIFSNLRNHYSSLCATVHTNTPQSDEWKTCFNKFPFFNYAHAKDVRQIYCSLIESVMSVLYFEHYTLIWQMHHNNRIAFFQSVPKIMRRTIYEYKTRGV